MLGTVWLMRCLVDDLGRWDGTILSKPTPHSRHDFFNPIACAWMWARLNVLLGGALGLQTRKIDVAV